MTTPRYGQIKDGLGSLIGNAGEHFVVGELLRRGLIAGLAPRNAADFDVVVISGSASVNIRVKTKTSASFSWAWNAKPDGTVLRNIGRNDVTVMVDLGSVGDRVQYYLADTADVDARLRADFEEWRSSPGKNGQQRDQANKVRRFVKSRVDEEFLGHAKDHWALITERLEMSN